jgi:DNA polymerase-3 subunit alpha
LEPVEHYLKARDLNLYINRRILIYGYLVTYKSTKTSSGNIMCFGNFLDKDGDFIDTVHFPNIAYHFPFRGKGIYSITGIVKEEFGCISIEVSRMERLAIVEDPRYSDAKNQKKIA